MFQEQYGGTAMAAPEAQLLADARTRWENTVGGLQDAMRVQAGVVGNLDGQRAEIAALVGASQNAVGALQAAQAGNQLVALQTRQIADLTALVAAEGRAGAIAAARAAADEAQAREQGRRFRGAQTPYVARDVSIFRD